jgi:hypothetical protein
MKTFIAALLLASLCSSAIAQPAAPKKPDWTSLKFLAGSWIADPNPDEPGVTGSTDFRFELDDNVLVRENKADYPPQNGKPALHHRDLMVVFADDSGAWKATYWDNEPHTIQYDVTASPGEVFFTTPSGAPGPRFRLVYRRTVIDNSVAGRFEIAAPGGEFRTYKQWTMHRAPAAH